MERDIDDLGDSWMGSIQKSNLGTWSAPNLVARVSSAEAPNHETHGWAVCCLSTYLDAQTGVDGIIGIARPITPNIEIAERALRRIHFCDMWVSEEVEGLFWKCEIIPTRRKVSEGFDEGRKCEEGKNKTALVESEQTHATAQGNGHSTKKRPKTES